MEKIKLPQVTLIALTSRDFDSHQKALDISSEHIDFGAVKLIKRPDIKTIDEWSRVIVYELTNYVDTDFAILIHADGYITRPDLWRDGWLDYDYIGAPFPLPKDNFSYRDIKGDIQRVGNSVSLRSKKLLDLPKKLDMPWLPFHGYYNEDGYISVNMRHVFFEHGCKFAPLRIAKHFSKEHEIPENKGLETFAFHTI